MKSMTITNHLISLVRARMAVQGVLRGICFFVVSCHAVLWLAAMPLSIAELLALSDRALDEGGVAADHGPRPEF